MAGGSASGSAVVAAVAERDALVRPLEVIDRIFATASGGSADGARDHDAFVATVAASFAAAFADESALARIPLLSRRTLRRGTIAPNTLVRYVGMVQDMYEPDWYRSLLRDGDAVRTMAFREPLTPHDEAMRFEGDLQQRSTLFVVPLPGEAAWSRRRYGLISATADTEPAAEVATPASPPAPAISAHGKRRRDDHHDAAVASGAAMDLVDDDDDADGAGEEAVRAGSSATRPPAAKRRLLASERHAIDSSSGSVAVATGAGMSSPPAGTGRDYGSGVAQGHPLPDEVELPALVRMYGDGHGLRLSDAVECVGVYAIPDEDSHTLLPTEENTLRPGLESHAAAPGEEDDGDAFLAAARAVHNPPSFQAPRLHCIFFRRLAPTFPLLQPPPTASVTLHVAPPAAGKPSSAAAGAAEAPTASVTVLPYGLFGATTPPLSLPPELGIPRFQLAMMQAALAASAAVQASQETAAAALSAFLAATPGVGMAVHRAELHSYLAQALGGDDIAAEWLLLHLISGVRARRGMEVVGALALGVRGLPDEGTAGTAPSVAAGSPLTAAASRHGRRIADVLTQLVPRVALLPLSTASLNTLTFASVKDPASEKLAAGFLQLPAGTSLVVDASVLGPGTAEARGMDNLRSLQELLSHQHQTFQFPYAEPQRYPCDVRVLLLAHRGALVTPDAWIQLAPDAVASLAADEAAELMQLDEEFVARARTFLAVARALQCTIQPAVAELVKEDLVAMKAVGRNVATAGDMHRLLNVARLMGQSLGEPELTPELWERVKALEAARVATLDVTVDTPTAAAGSGVAGGGAASV